MTERRQATDEEARALASALRLRILRICLDEGRTNQEIAQILGRDPASILHHIRTLVRTGFLEPQQERRGARGAREIPYLATRKSWQLSTPAQDRAMLDTFLEEVALVPAADLDMTRLGLRLPGGRLGGVPRPGSATCSRSSRAAPTIRPRRPGPCSWRCIPTPTGPDPER